MTDDQNTATRPRRRWLPPLIISIAIAVAALLIATKPKPQSVEIAERSWRISAEIVVPGQYRPSVTLYGRVESLWSTELTAGVAAEVEAVDVIEGDSVDQGQPMLRLDQRDTALQLQQRQAELRQAEARIETELRRHEANLEAMPREEQLLALTRSEVNRLRGLVEKQVGAQSQLDTARQALARQAIAVASRKQAVDEHDARLAEAEAARVKAEALRDQAQLELDRTAVVSPFNGRVSEVMVAPGRRVRVGDPLIRLFDTDALIVRAQLPNRHLPGLRAALARGEPPEVAGEIDGVPIKARLRGLAGEAASGSGGIDGLFSVLEGAEQVSEGRFVRLNMQLAEQDDLLALPQEAVYGTDRIYRVDDEQRMRAETIERVGQWTDDTGITRVLVRAPDLPSDARVVLTQLPNALEGLLVNVVGED